MRSNAELFVLAIVSFLVNVAAVILALRATRREERTLDPATAG